MDRLPRIDEPCAGSVTAILYRITQTTEGTRMRAAEWLTWQFVRLTIWGTVVYVLYMMGRMS